MLKEGKRIKKIDPRFTEDELKIILELETTLGICKTDLARNGLLKNSQLIIFNAKELITPLDKGGTELGSTVNNINQLAHYANMLI